MKKTLDELRLDLLDRGPDRYLLNALTGEATTRQRLELMQPGASNLMDCILIRDDGWALAIQLPQLRAAWKMFEEEWVGLWLKGTDHPIPVNASEPRLLLEMQTDFDNLQHPPNRLELRRRGANWVASAHWGSGDQVPEVEKPDVLPALCLLVQQLQAGEPDLDAC